MKTRIFLLTLGFTLLWAGIMASLFWLIPKPEEKLSAPLTINWAMMENDSIPVDDAALFLENAADSQYNDCECTQNIPIIDGADGLKLVEPQEIYAEQPAIVLAYSPFRENAKVDSIPWSIFWYGDLKVADPCLATTHIPEVNLTFQHRMGLVRFRIDGDSIPTSIILRGEIPVEGSYNLLTGKWHITKSATECQLRQEEQVMLPRTYKHISVNLDGFSFCMDLKVQAGKITSCSYNTRDKKISQTLKNW